MDRYYANFIPTYIQSKQTITLNIILNEAAIKCPFCKSPNISRLNVENVLNPPQIPIIKRPFHPAAHEYFVDKITNIPNSRLAKAFANKVAQGIPIQLKEEN